MPRLYFTTKSIESIKPTHGQRVEYWDSSTRNFGLRVTENGRKTWFLMYVFNHRKRRLSLGVFPDIGLSEARLRARKAQQRIDIDGVDPGEQKKQQRNAETFGELSEQYLDLHAKVKKKSWREDQRILCTYFLPRWKHYKASTISRRDVLNVLDEFVARGSFIQGNRALAVIRKMYNWGIQRDIVQMNPCHLIPNPGHEKKRERVLSDDEIRCVWKALENEQKQNSAYFKLLMITAQRPGEVAAMKWSQIDLNSAWWTLPDSKNRHSHRVPLCDWAIRILQDLKTEGECSDWVFKSRGRDLPVRDYKKLLCRIKENSGVEFTRHDLRRTATSKMTSMGIYRLTVGKILNHAEKDVTAVYDRYSYDLEKKEALNAWAKKLAFIVNEGAEGVSLSDSSVHKGMSKLSENTSTLLM